MTVYHWCFLLGCWLGMLWLLCHYLQSARRHRRRKRHAPAPAKGFRPAPPRRSGGRPKPPWAIAEALRLYDATGSYRLATYAFNRLYAHQGVSVCPTTVYTWVRKHRSDMETVRLHTRNRFPRPAPPNLRWCLDATGKRDGQGNTHFILGIIDHGTRLCLTLQRLEHGTTDAILRQIAAAVERFGKPRFLRTDNARVFRCPAFERGLAQIGIRHEFSEPGKPWQNGRIERLFLTLKQKLNAVTPDDGAALDRLLAAFRHWYNVIRPHQHLHGLTPHEAWCGIDPYRSAPRSVERFSAWGGLLTGFYLRR
jgi:transposase InsO family protein